MYSSRTKVESCEFFLLNTCQNQYWNITGMGNSIDTKYLLKHLFRMLTLSILRTTDDPIHQEDMVCCCRPGVARLVRVKSAVGTAGPGGLSLFSGRRRGLGLYKSAHRSVEKWRLLGSLVSRFRQWWIILQSAMLTEDMFFSVGMFDETNFAACFWNDAPRRPVKTEQTGQVHLLGFRWGAALKISRALVVSQLGKHSSLLRNAQAVAPSC